MLKRITYLLTLLGLLLHLNVNAQEDDGNIQFKSIDTGEYNGSVLLPRPVKKVIIDPGHGGRDEGAQGSHSQEKAINLAIAQKLGEKIKMGFSDITVVHTRRSDITVSLPERAQIANVQRGDLLISIHCNALSEGKVYGTEIYVVGNFEDGQASSAFKRENKLDSPDDLNRLQNYGDAFQGYSLEFAAKIDRELRNYAGRKSLGIKREPFIVLRASNMPGVLIETGFLTNSEEENYLLSDSGQERIAEAIYRAFVDYKAENDAVTMSFVPNRPARVVTPPPAPPAVVTTPPKVITQPVIKETPVTIAPPKVKETPVRVITPPVVKEAPAKVIAPPKVETKPKEVTPPPVVEAPSRVLTPSTETPPKVASISALDSRNASTEKPTSVATATSTPVTTRSTATYSSSTFKRGTSRVDLPKAEITDAMLEDLLEDAKYNAEADYTPQFRKEYKVQLLILSDQLDKNTSPWNEVYHLDIEPYGGKFSYLAAGYWDYESAEKGQNYWRTNGFPDATIVTYKNGQRQ